MTNLNQAVAICEIHFTSIRHFYFLVFYVVIQRMKKSNSLCLNYGFTLLAVILGKLLTSYASVSTYVK